jgi:hypothetical protein
MVDISLPEECDAMTLVCRAPAAWGSTTHRPSIPKSQEVVTGNARLQSQRAPATCFTVTLKRFQMLIAPVVVISAASALSS